MRDWLEIDLSPMFKKGMVDNKYNRLFLQSMEDVLGHRVTEFGLQPLDVPSLISSDSDLSGITFPLPSFIIGEKNLHILDFDEFFSLTLPGGGATVLPVYLAPDVTSTTLVRGGDTPDVYHFADAGSSWFATDGTLMVFRYDNKIVLSQKKVPNTLCGFKGRVYLGGLAGNARTDSEFWDSDYISNLQDLLNADVEDFETPAALGQNVVYYTTVGAEDLLSHYLETQSLEALRALTKRKESGFVGMPWRGIVRVVKPLGDGVMVYGEDGVTFIKPEVSPIAMRLVTTTLEGIPSRRCVCGDRSIHYFLGNNGALWSIDSKLQIKELDYSDTIASLGTLSTIILNYDSTYGDVYLASATHSRLITPFGMSRLNEAWISMTRYAGVRTGFYTDLAIYTDTTATTGVIRFPGGGFGTVHGMQLMTRNPAAHIVSIRYRRNEDEGWTTYGNIPVSKSGFCDFLITTYELDIHIETDTSLETTTLEGATLFYDTTSRGLGGLI